MMGWWWPWESPEYVPRNTIMFGVVNGQLIARSSLHILL